MGNSYKKAKGSAGSKGVDFQIDLLTVFLLNAFRRNIRDWQLSTENVLAGKFDDVVFELSDGSAILLQAKHKESRKITLEQLLSPDSKNDDFSLPKYFLSYLDIRTKFQLKFLIICTNTQADPGALKCLNQSRVGEESMLYYKDGASFFTVEDSALGDLITNAKIYHKNNSNNKNIDKAMITEGNGKEFLKHLQLYFEYPSGSGVVTAIGNVLSSLKSSCNLLHNISYHDLTQKVKHWFEQSKGEYITEHRLRAIFCEIKSSKHLESLEDYKISFKNKSLKTTLSEKRILHVVIEEEHLLYLMKVYHSLQTSNSKVLYAGSNYGSDVQKQMIKAFELPLYTYLIIDSPNFSEESVISDICIGLSDILKSKRYKKIVFVAERNNVLADRMKAILDDYDVFEENLTLEDLSEGTQEMLLQKNSVIFQGENVSLEELFPEQITENHKKNVQSEILQKIITGEKIPVGRRLADLEEEVYKYYVNRKFQGTAEEPQGNRIIKVEEVTVPENDLFKTQKKVILICDSAGMGKTTVLKNLANTIKKNNPRLWVVRIELNHVTKVLKDSLNNGRSINIWDLSKHENSNPSTYGLEKLIFSLKAKVVLMLDGVDEISPDYTKLILDVLLQSQKAENLAKVFVTTRTHMAQELEKQLKVTSLRLVPLTEQDQIDLFTRYWSSSVKDESKSKCELYATAFISKVTSWMMEWQTEVKFVASPLHARLLAEVFSENKESEEWQGCREYLDADQVEPELPDKMNISKLYEMVIEKKRDIFMDKGNPSGNTASNPALKEQFDNCLDYHRSLALEAILDESTCTFFSCYQHHVRDNAELTQKVLKMGIVHELDNELNFVHRTFAEYFVADVMVKELRLQNQDVGFQRFLINEVFFNGKFKIIRRFLDYSLYNHIPSLTSDTFKTYMSFVSDTVDPSLIHKLAGEGNTDIICLILKCIDFKIVRGREVSSDFHRCALTKINALNILKDLVKRGGINIKHQKGSTPLLEATAGGHLDTVQFLLEMGANVNHQTQFKEEVITSDDYWKSKFNAHNIHGPNLIYPTGDAILHFAVWKGYFHVVELLVTHGAKITTPNEYGYTALHFAAKRGWVDIVELLLKRDKNTNISERFGNRPVHFAAERGSLQTVKLLVEHGADTSMANERGYTTLHFAVARGSLEIVKFLVELKIDVNIQDNQGCTALHLAAVRGNLEIVKFLVEHELDVYIEDKKGYTALHRAAEWNRLEIVKCLLEHGVDVRIAKEGYTALHLAAEWGRLEIVKVLVDHDVDVDIVTKKGCTALHFAAKKGRLETTKFLVDSGADVTITNNTGCTALNLATRRNGDHLEIVKFLVEHDVDANISKERLHGARFCR